MTGVQTCALPIFEIQIHKKNAAGRVSRLTTRWTDGKKIMELPVTGVQLREWLGPQRFRSASFALTEHKSGAGARWFFQGRGNGHGVGMCQWGAKVMGDKGYSMAAILKHYYPDAVLSKLW